MTIIADITGAFDNTEPRFVNALKSIAQTSGAARIVLVLRERQRARATHEFEPFAVDNLYSPEQTAKVILEQLVLPILGSGSETVQILSLNIAILEITGKVPWAAATKITSFHWFKIPPLGQQPWAPLSQNDAPTAGWSDKAVEALLDMLARFPDGVRKSSLREMLRGASAEFEKRPGGQPISALVGIAQKRGQVEVSPIGHVNPYIRLVSRPQFRAQPLSPEKSALALDPPSHAIKTTPPTPVAANAGLLTDNHELVANEKIEVPATLPEIGTTAAHTLTPPTRIQKLFGHFRAADMGPFSADRDCFYAEIQSLVDLGTYSSNRIVKKAARNVIAQRQCTYPWNAAEKFLSNLLHRQPVLLDEEGIERDPTTIASFSRPIKKLKEDWQRLLDAELLYFLAEADGSLAVAEMETIAYVLYPGVDEDERLARVEGLFGLLSSLGRTDTNNGIFVTKSGRGELASPPPSAGVVVLNHYQEPTSPSERPQQKAS